MPSCALYVRSSFNHVIYRTMEVSCFFLQGIQLGTKIDFMINKDHVYLEKLQNYYAYHRIIPAHNGLADLIGLSKRGAAKFIDRMVFAGYLSKAPDGRAIPENFFFARSIVGVVPAGFASPATELPSETIVIDEYLIENPSSTVVITVKGESMINAGILEGDSLIVERNASPKLNCIVVAIVDGDFTVKYLRKDEQGPFLEPANDLFPVIRPEASLEIYGEVVGVFRKTKC